MRSIGIAGRMGLTAVIALASAAALPAAPVAAGEPATAVTDWNVNATTAIVGVAKQPPAAAILSYAMVEGAVYDAVNAIDRGHQPYLAEPAATGTESETAAAAQAAHDVLVSLFPAQALTLDAQLATSLGAVTDATARAAGQAIGAATAAAMLAARTGDGRGGPQVAVPGTLPGQWRPTPPLFAVDPVSWVGNVRPFLLPSGSMFRSDGPNALTSAAYAADVAEVKSLGSATSTTRTPDETDAAIWWQDHGVALYNRIVRNVAVGRGLGIVDAARLFAMTDLAGADAMINCWNDKYYWNFWRPITAIRLAGTDGNPATVADPSWTPLIATPPFPDHPSGHSCEVGAFANTLQAFFHTDKVSFSAFSNNSQTTRHFTRFSLMLKEVLDARVWGGIHFRTADVQGSVIGMKVSHYVVNHFFAPTP
jgi:hypothetical protein